MNALKFVCMQKTVIYDEESKHTEILTEIFIAFVFAIHKKQFANKQTNKEKLYMQYYYAKSVKKWRNTN